MSVLTGLSNSFGITNQTPTGSYTVKTGSNPTEGTTLLTIRVNSLDPGPGPATVTYIFGNKSKKLIQVNVAWGEDVKSLKREERLEHGKAGIEQAKSRTFALQLQFFAVTSCEKLYKLKGLA